jgi:hypothetical protein
MVIDKLKKMGDQNNFFLPRFEATTYFTYNFNFDPLTFNSTLPSKNVCNWMLI